MYLTPLPDRRSQALALILNKTILATRKALNKMCIGRFIVYIHKVHIMWQAIGRPSCEALPVLQNTCSRSPRKLRFSSSETLPCFITGLPAASPRLLPRSRPLNKAREQGRREADIQEKHSQHRGAESADLFPQTRPTNSDIVNILHLDRRSLSS